jgi:extracellular elastinolytic metalloproteinase
MARSHTSGAALAGVATFIVIAAMAQGAAVAAPGAQPDKSGSDVVNRDGDSVHRQHFDSRLDGRSGAVLQSRAAQNAAKPKAAVSTLKTSLGVQGLVTIDPLTGSPRQIARADGFLSGPSLSKASDIAMSYVRAHQAVFGLDASALAGLTLRQDYVDVDGSHHLSFVQTVGGIPVFGNGLKAHVAKGGQLVSFTGSPLTTLTGLPASHPAVSASAARVAAVKDAGGKAGAQSAKAPAGLRAATLFANGDRASLVWFKTLGGTVLAWQTQVASSKELYSSVVDATSGRVLYRDSLVNRDTAVVWENYPGAPLGGAARRVDLPRTWLPTRASILSGNNAHVFIDINDDNAASATEEIRPSSRGHFDFPFTSFPSTIPGLGCTRAFPCSWDPNLANSWRTNANQDATQVFYYVNKYHDHLAKGPIGFTPAAGNFEGVDAVDTQPLDGADTANGLPDAGHIDNANMSTLPDGQAPTMQMFLFHQPGADATQDPFIASNGGDEADIVYHEYTHGLSNRLVVDANGNSTLGNVQAGSMGEAWSDWYAMDFLANEGFVRDTRADGDLRVGQYVGAGKDLIRTQPMDCAVASRSPKCPGIPAATGVPAKPGGFTYGDFGKIAGGPEVHADGEIWGETLWDLRTRIGSTAAESLVTRAMELSPANPSYLDMRNAILQADSVQGGRRNAAIWRVFAHRGMGYFAAALNGDDSTPFEDFSMPPAPNAPKGSVTGTVTDDATNAALPGAVVAFGGHASAPGFSEYLAGTANAAGRYTIPGIFFGTYRDVSAVKPGFDTAVDTVTVAAATTTRDFSLRRDWAASGGGASVAAFNGPDFTSFGCGPGSAIDQSLGNGWGSTSADHAGGAADFSILPKFVVVKLPQAVDVSAIAIDPGNTCGDAGSASTKDFRVETTTSTDLATAVWNVANQGSFVAADRHRLNPLTPAAGTASAVTFVRFTMINPQVPGDFTAQCTIGGFSGCDFMDMSELEVFGTPTP